MRVLIADRDLSFIKSAREHLVPAGHQVVAEVTDGISALRMARSMQPELAILDAFLPGMDGLEVGRIIQEARIAPVIMTATYSEREIMEHKEGLPFPVLPKPVDFMALKSLIEYVQSTFKKVAALEKEVLKLQNNLATRKLVEKAKGIIMKTQGLSEEAAFKKMQQLSMKKRVSMKNIAKAIILAHEK